MAHAREGRMDVFSKQSSSYTSDGADTTEAMSSPPGSLQQRPVNMAFGKEHGDVA